MGLRNTESRKSGYVTFNDMNKHSQSRPRSECSAGGMPGNERRYTTRSRSGQKNQRKLDNDDETHQKQTLWKKASVPGKHIHFQKQETHLVDLSKAAKYNFRVHNMKDLTKRDILVKDGRHYTMNG